MWLVTSPNVHLPWPLFQLILQMVTACPQTSQVYLPHRGLSLSLGWLRRQSFLFQHLLIFRKLQGVVCRICKTLMALHMLRLFLLYLKLFCLVLVFYVNMYLTAVA